MRTHKATCLEGPITADRPWWRQPEAPGSPPPVEGGESLFRAGLVDEIRREIAAGTYETPEKWEIALDRLLRRLEDTGE
ncbi:MAG: hypothetical protein L0Z62_39790 [Gemmataceae bacterium]|nr:hypothetical protein [Gemmataceae bacterium]